MFPTYYDIEDVKKPPQLTFAVSCPVLYCLSRALLPPCLRFLFQTQSFAKDGFRPRLPNYLGIRPTQSSGIVRPARFYFYFYFRNTDYAQPSCIHSQEDSPLYRVSKWDDGTGLSDGVESSAVQFIIKPVSTFRSVQLRLPQLYCKLPDYAVSLAHYVVRLSSFSCHLPVVYRIPLQLSITTYQSCDLPCVVAAQLGGPSTFKNLQENLQKHPTRPGNVTTILILRTYATRRTRTDCVI